MQFHRFIYRMRQSSWAFGQIILDDSSLMNQEYQQYQVKGHLIVTLSDDREVLITTRSRQQNPIHLNREQLESNVFFNQDGRIIEALRGKCEIQISELRSPSFTI